MARRWTQEQKDRQSALIRSWKPWTRSTGPRTTQGKAQSSKNRQKTLEKAQREVADARKALTEAQARLGKLGAKPRVDLMTAVALTTDF
ncbi:MAG: hypothetical protein GJU73_09275 [Ferrovum sp.]|jgi:hypothetical protein|uniref:hypothetical protein n=1 Tax=Ferrovum sp. TaxID=2609467 RepID=UPI002635AB51|nr:hypothetical protein [Ferrovum sp.]MBW8067622.1 hypothetical protein [Ferrovum sp.]